MSSGLTWVTLFDPENAAPDVSTAPTVFSIYNEAYEYSRFLLQYAISNQQGGAKFQVLIWTTGPNANGVWYASGATATFAQL
jgi:hypothetical protein